MKLEILIPTYNRCDYLIKNLKLLEKIILDLDLVEEVGVFVSNNASVDETESNLSFFSNNSKIIFRYSSQCSNVGLERNALKCLSDSSADYVMFLGDDDYIHPKYLEQVFSEIFENKVHMVCPSYVGYNLEGKIVDSRDDKNVRVKMRPGEKAALFFSWRNHQLSGLVYKNNSLFEKYRKSNVSNIYPFVFLGLISCLSGESVLLPDFPVHVTVPPQKNKDWGYGDDGLIDDIFNNYKCHQGISYRLRILLELTLCVNQYWRIYGSIKSRNLMFYKSLFLSKNSSTISKLVIFLTSPLACFFLGAKRAARRFKFTMVG